MSYERREKADFGLLFFTSLPCDPAPGSGAKVKASRNRYTDGFVFCSLSIVPYKIPESVLVVIYTSEREVLLLERADRPGFWQSVTGSKDREDEELRSTAIREVLEETGIDAIQFPLSDWRLANIYEIYPVWRHRYAPGVTHNKEHVFGLCVPRSISVTLAPREHLRYQWLPMAEAADQCFSPSNAEAILQLSQRLNTA